MKEGWDIKKLGEVCTITMGQSPNSTSYNKLGDGLPFFQGCSDFGTIHPLVTTWCNQPNKIAKPNDILMSVRAPIGTLNIADSKCCIGRGLAAFTQIEGVTIYKFLYYFLLSSKDDLQSKGTGATFKAIGKELIKNYVIKLPSLSEQQHIVEELELLSSILEKKKAQLKELDNLAQSLFYEMFGDPITNEKGWEISKLVDICRLFAGGDVPKERFSRTKTEKYKIPIFSNGLEEHGLYGYTDIPKVTDKCITITGRGTIGHVEKRCEAFYPIIRLIVAIPVIPMNITYLTYLATLQNFQGNGGAIPQLTVPMIKNTKCPIPPLDLQNQFAERVKAIENQKELIKKSIKEVETLFSSRMDYYFN